MKTLAALRRGEVLERIVGRSRVVDGDARVRLESFRVFCLPRDSENKKVRIGIYAILKKEKSSGYPSHHICVYMETRENERFAYARYKDMIQKLRCGDYRLVLNRRAKPMATFELLGSRR